MVGGRSNKQNLYVWQDENSNIAEVSKVANECRKVGSAYPCLPPNYAHDLVAWRPSRILLISILY